MHNKSSSFFANDKRKARWIHESQKAMPERKAKGHWLWSLIFCHQSGTVWWASIGLNVLSNHLILIRCISPPVEREPHVVFNAGKNWDGYFDADDLLEQVDKAIDIFEDHMFGFATGLFLLIMHQVIKVHTWCNFGPANIPKLKQQIDIPQRWHLL